MRSEGDLWRQAREKKGVTQDTLAAKLGFASPQYVSNVERGLCTMSRKHFKKLAKIFGAKAVDEIIEYRGERLKASLRDVL